MSYHAIVRRTNLFSSYFELHPSAMKVAWKVINGYGPYAYLQEAVWQGNNKVVSKHIKYLGSFGKGGVLPGNKVKGYPKVRISVVPRELVVQLKPKPAEKVRDYHNKLKKKMGSYEISDDDMNQWLETLEETLLSLIHI